MEWLNRGVSGSDNRWWWIQKIWVGAAFLFVAVLSFQAGWLKQSLSETEPLVISSPEKLPEAALPKQVEVPLPTAVLSAAGPAGERPEQKPCLFVGSRNSNKYHAPLSRCAKQIKPANLVCFESAEAAVAKGYLPGCLK